MYIVWIWFGICLILFTRRWTIHSQNLAASRAKVQLCRDIVEFSYTGSSLAQVDRLRLRAGPNKRLVQVFAIENSFTTTDPRVHKMFLRTATQPLQRLSQETWIALFHNTIHILREERLVARADTSSRALVCGIIPLASCVRRLCFNVIFSILFDQIETNPCTMLRQDVDTVTTEINTQWLRSKTEDTKERSVLLESALLRLIASSSKPATTPETALNMILPAYETLWRVVMLTFVSVSHRERSPRDLERLYHLPECIGRGNDKEMQARLIAKEGLRLFPSTKRVYRCASLSDIGAETVVSADIEACQRDPMIWGKDSTRFRPERFETLSNIQREAYMPFGLRPHICPASASTAFGERVVTLLVAALDREFGRHRAEILFNNTQLDDKSSSELPTGRADTEDWVLVV